MLVHASFLSCAMDYLGYMDYSTHISRISRAVNLEIEPFVDFTDEEFIDRYRLSKENARILIELVSPSLGEVPNNRGNPVPIWKKVLVALRFFADGTLHRETGDLLGVSESTACRYVHKVAMAICRTLRKKYIKFPTNAYATETKETFYRLGGFPGVLSCIDGTHVPILCPSTDDNEEFRNRKGYFSINVLGAAGAHMEFTFIVARWKGSTHDSRIFRNSSLYARFERGEANGILLGDSGYQCNRFLVTPYANPVTPGQMRYQTSHIKTRSIVERMFGLWKNRFRCLHSQNTLRFSPHRCCTIIVACATLHNFIIKQEQPVFQVADNDYDLGVDEEGNERENGIGEFNNTQCREDLVRRHFS